MYDCVPPTAENSTVLIGDLTPSSVECYGKLDLVFHCESDMRLTLTNVAFIPGLGVILFLLHAIAPKNVVTIDGSGVHLLDGRLSFPRYDAGSHLAATRICQPPSIVQTTPVFPPVTLSTIAPGNAPVPPTVNINDMHVSYAHAHDAVLRETAKQLGIRLTGKLVS